MVDFSDTVLSLQHQDNETGKLIVRVAEGSATALGNTVDRLEGVAANFTATAPITAADIASATGDAVTSVVESDLVESLTALFNSLGILVKVGDEISKVRLSCRLGRSVLILLQIHPWLSLAWNVVSVGLKVRLYLPNGLMSNI